MIHILHYIIHFIFHIQLEGSKYDHLLNIREYCHKKFIAVRAKGGIIHEMDIRKWAKQRSIEVNRYC